MEKNDNYKKAVIGSKVKNRMNELLGEIENKGYVKKVDKAYSITDPKLKGSNHFKFDFKIDFHDDSSWIVHCTNSIRTDRLKGNLFEAEHIKRLNPKIENAFLVYPDQQSSKDLKEAQRVSEKIKDYRIYSPIDDVLSFRGIEFLIQSKAMNLTSSSSGYRYAVKGLDFESLIVDILNDINNKERWNRPEVRAIGRSYDWYYTILNKFGYIEGETIKKISATKKIPRLPSGGSPKTDVTVTISTYSGQAEYNLSCKRVTGDFVTIHEYSYVDFVKALHIKEDSLVKALKEFQIYGGERALKKNSPESYEILDSLMKLYNERLINWAFFGVGGEGRGNQVADLIVTWNETTNSFSILSRDQYIKKQLLVEGQFHTPFKWTYASKSKGKSIQLKGKVN